MFCLAFFFWSGKRLVDIFLKCPEGSQNLRLSSSQYSCDTNAGRNEKATKVTFSRRETSSIRILNAFENTSVKRSSEEGTGEPKKNDFPRRLPCWILIGPN